MNGERTARVGAASLRWATTFAHESQADFLVTPTRIATATENTRLRHQQAASVLRLTTGELLVACRWDEQGTAEGDATNEQALYSSADDGASWTMANGGNPIVTLEAGTSFDRPSSITHAFPFEDATGATWLYYSVNQPFTWGRDEPQRSTGGGEIRRIRIVRSYETWESSGPSEVVWAFRAPIDDGRGGLLHDVRALCLNGIIRLRSGRLVMPIAGRSTVDDPRGANWPLDRCWILASDDGGATWPESCFIGGGPSLCLCEPTIVETGTDNYLVALMRAQYDTARELYRSVSADGGRTWSSPAPTGLPNTLGSGVKPYLTRLGDGRYALLQTNEHWVTDRTNVSVFLTDESGLATDRWDLVKVLSAECREHWLGSAYGWLSDAGDGALDAVWVSFTPGANHLNHVRVEDAWLHGTVVEPLAPRDASGDDLPKVVDLEDGGRGLWFPAFRSRAHAPHFGALAGVPSEIRVVWRVGNMPLTHVFPLLDLRARNGRHPWVAICLGPPESGTIFVHESRGWIDTGIRPTGGTIGIGIRTLSPTQCELSIHGQTIEGPCLSRTSTWPTTLYLGGNISANEACGLVLEEVAYGAARQPGDTSAPGRRAQP